jgi:hypothetical protein
MRLASSNGTTQGSLAQDQRLYQQESIPFRLHACYTSHKIVFTDHRTPLSNGSPTDRSPAGAPPSLGTRRAPLTALHLPIGNIYHLFENGSVQLLCHRQ